MKIFVVSGYNPNMCVFELDAVFSTREKAVKFCETHSPGNQLVWERYHIVDGELESQVGIDCDGNDRWEIVEKELDDPTT